MYCYLLFYYQNILYFIYIFLDQFRIIISFIFISPNILTIKLYKNDLIKQSAFNFKMGHPMHILELNY